MQIEKNLKKPYMDFIINILLISLNSLWGFDFSLKKKKNLP